MYRLQSVDVKTAGHAPDIISLQDGVDPKVAATD